MPDLLLSSAPKKDLTPSVMVGSANSSLETGKNALSSSETQQKQRDGFTNVLSSVVNKTSNSEAINDEASTSAIDDGLKELGVLVENIQEQLSSLDSGSGLFQDLNKLLNGNGLSLEELQNSQNGANLPDILSKLEAMLEQASEALQVNSEELDLETRNALNIAFTQGIELAKSVTGMLQNNQRPDQFSPTLLGFAFNNDTGRSQNTNWQKYDPQQLSQSNTASTTNINTNADVLSLDNGLGNTVKGQSTQHLVSKTDQSFHAQMDQLVSGNLKESSGLLSESPLNSLVDVKEKPNAGFSDLQIKTPGDSLKQYSTTLSTPVNAQDWGEEVSQKIVWFTGRNIQAAEMHLNPAELGPIDVKIQVQNDVATVTFNANNASVRDLLESNVVRLREMMEANGVNMGDVNVDSGSQQQSNESGGDPNQAGFAGNDPDGVDTSNHDGGKEQVISLKETNLVDYFV